MGFNNNIGRWTPDAPSGQSYGGQGSSMMQQNYGGSPWQQQVQQGNQYMQQGGQAPMGMLSETNPQLSSLAQALQQLFSGDGGGVQGQQGSSPVNYQQLQQQQAQMPGGGLGPPVPQSPMAQAIQQQMFQPTISQQDYNAIPWQSQDMYYGEM